MANPIAFLARRSAKRLADFAVSNPLIRWVWTGPGNEDYANALFLGNENRLNLCVPGGKETQRMLKALYAEMEGDGKPAAVVASNPGQALWSGIVDPEKAALTAKRLLAEDLFCGWGVRTLSAKERAYNPLSYHLGSVWPHDNSLIAAGLRRYGFDDEALQIFNGLSQAAIHFKAYQLPELFCGFDQREYHVPIPYPVADHPQAWASGSMPYLVSTLLGLRPEAFDRRLRIVRPMLPDSVNTLELHRLRIGHAKVDLRFERARNGQVLVHVLNTEGDLTVIVEPPSPVSRSSGRLSPGLSSA